MAKMSQVRPVRTKNINTKWLKNALNSVGASATSTLKSYAPNISEVVSSSVSAAKSVTTRTKSASQTFRSLNNNRYIKLANTAFKNAINDIKAGNIAGHQGMSSDSEFSDPFSDSGITFGDEGDVNINYYNNSGAEEGMITLSDSVNRNTELTLTTSKAQMDAYVAVSSAMMYQSSEIGKEIITHLAGIENNLAALVEYHNTNMNKFIESSMAFYDRMGANAEKDEYGGSRKVNASDVVAGGFNLSKYREYVTAQFKKNLDSSEFGLLKSVLDNDMLQMMAENPLSIVMDFGMGAIMPKMISTTLKGMEQTFNSMMPNLLQRLHQWGEEQAGSMFKNITGTIAKSFGISMEKTNYIRKSDVKIDRGPMPFDGETKNAITNIITKELREQTVYLKYIAGHFGLNTDAKVKRVLGEATFFDYYDNEFIQMKDLDKTLVKRIQKSVNEGFDRTPFGRTMRQTIAGGTGNKQEMEGILTQFYNMMESSGKGYNYFNREVPKEILDGISKFTGSVESLNAFTDMLTKIIQENPSVAMSISQGQMAARNRREQEIVDILQDPAMSGILQSNVFNTKKRKKDLAPGEDPDSVYSVDELLMQYAQGITKDARSKKKVQTQMDVLGTMNRGDGINREARDLLNRFRGIGGEGLKGFGSAIIRGDTQAAFDTIGSVFVESGKTLVESMNENFFRPIKNALFGTKNEAGFSEGGMFSGATNAIKDMTMEVAHQISGREYVDSKGKRHEENPNSVMGNIKTALTEKFFGKTAVDKDGKPTGEREQGIFSFITNGIKDSFVNWHDAFFGELDEKGEKVTRDNVMQKMTEALQKRLPKGMVGGVAGGAFGLASGGLLGAMIGGPIGGVVIGTAAGLASDSDKFKKWLFGDKELDNGFISKKTQEYFKKNKNPLIAGAVLGGAKGLFTGGGFLGTLVGGPVAGALLGMATTTALKSQTFHNFLFGDEKNGQLGIINSFKHAMRQVSGSGDKDASMSLSGKMVGMGAVGAAAGALTGSALSHIGLLGALAGPAGPIGGALLGLGLTIRSQGDTFKEWLFGNKKKKTDDDYDAGIIGKFLNTVQANLLNPLRDTVSNLATDAAITFKYDMLGVIEYAIEPITIAAGNIANRMKKRVKGFFNFLGNKISDKLVSPIISVADRILIRPFKTFATGLAKLAYGAAKQIVTLPFKMIKAAVDWMTSPIRKVFQAAFHPIRTSKWLLSKLGSVIEDKIGISLDPLRQTMDILKKTAGNAIKKTFGNIIKAPFRGIKAVGAGIAGGVTGIGEMMGRWGDKLAGRKMDQNQRDAEVELQNRYQDALKNGEVPTSEDGTPMPFDNWRRKFLEDNPEWRNRLRENNRAYDKAKARLDRSAKKARTKNEQQIVKYSGGNLREDTEENRAIVERKAGKKLKWNNIDAVDAGRTKDTANMTDEQLSNADPSKMSNEVRQTSILQRILDTLTGKKRKWNSQDQKQKEKEKFSWDNIKDFDKKGLDPILNFLKEKGFSDEELSNLSGKDLTRLFVESGFNLNDLVGGKMDEMKGRLSKIPGLSSILDKFSGKGYAAGTQSAAPGYAVVGENGPEVVHMNGGEQVDPAVEGGLPVYIVGLSKNIEKMIESSPSYGGARVSKDMNLLTENGQQINTDQSGASTALAVVSKAQTAKEKAMDLALTASEQQAAHEAEEEAERKQESHNALLAILDNTRKQEEGQSIFHKLWSSIFSKKGIITVAILGLIAKFLGADGVLSLLKLIGGGIASILGRIGAIAGDTVTSVINDATFQNEQNARTNGKSAYDELAEGGEDLQELMSGDLGGYLTNAEGQYDHRTASKANMLRAMGTAGAGVASTVRGGYSSVRSAIKNVKAGNLKKAAADLDTTKWKKKGSDEFIQSGVSKIRNAWNGRKGAQKATDAAVDIITDFDILDESGNVITSMGKNASDDVAGIMLPSVVGSSADDVIGIGTTAVANVGDDIAAKAVPEVLESASKTASTANRKLISKVIGMIKEFFDKVVSKVLGKKSSTVVKSAVDLASKTLSKHFSKIAKPIASILGVTAGLASTGIGLLAKEGLMITLGALNGATGAARLFQVNSDEVDGTMVLISTAMGAFTGSTIGSIVDVVTELVSATTGVNILNIAACAIYNALRGEEKYNELKSAQDAFKQSYVESTNEQISKTYDKLKKAGMLPTDENGNPISEDAFVTGVREGTYKATYDSFQDYNDKENASIGGKMLRGASKVGGAIGKGLTGIKNFFVGKKETYLEGKSGNIYKKNKDGTYDVYDSDGNLVVEGIDQSYFASDVEGVEEVTAKTSKGVVGHIASGFNALGKGLKTTGSFVVGAARGAGNAMVQVIPEPIRKVGSKIGGAILDKGSDIVNYFTETETVYYDSDGTYYKANDDGSFDKYSAVGSRLTTGGPYNKEDVASWVEQGILVPGTGPTAAEQDIKKGLQTIKNGAKNLANKFATTTGNIGETITNGASNLWNAGADKVSKAMQTLNTAGAKILDYISGDTKVVYYANDGTYYAQNEEGGYDHYNANGDPLTEGGTYTAEEISEMVSSGLLIEQIKHEPAEIIQDAGEVIKGFGKKLGSFFQKGFNAVKNIYGHIEEGIDKTSAVFNDIQENGLWNTVKGVFTSTTKQGWYDPSNGSYYVKNGDKYDHYNINGDLIASGLDPDPIDQQIALGSLTLYEIRTDSKAKSALRSIFSAADKAFDQAKKTVSNAWDTFRNWLNGGSGASSITSSRTVNANSSRSGSSNSRSIGGNGRGGGYGSGSIAPSTVNGYPYVSQEDGRWSGVDYDYRGDGGTIGDSGCGPAAMSMAISGVTGQKVSPVELARYAQKTGTRDDTGTNWNFVGDVAKSYGLSSNQTYHPSASSITDSLDHGHPVVLSGYSTGANTPYTSAGHYVVAVGRDRNGNILVNDPRGAEYSRSYSPQELSKYTGSSWEIGRNGGRGNTLFLRRFGGRGADELNGFPFLMQTDSRWSGTMYSAIGSSSQTIGSSGCGPTSMAMILRSYGADVTPVDTCQFALDNGFRTSNNGTAWGFFPAISAKYGLSTQANGLGVNGSAISSELDKKNPIVASMGPPTFTKGGHFIVLVGKDSSGNIIVNDPASRERSHAWPLSVFTNEGSNFWSFSKNGQGSINNLSSVGSIGGASTASTTNVTTTEGADNSSDILGKVSGFMGEVANRALEGLFTGEFNTDWDSYWRGVTTTTSVSASTSGTSTGATATSGANLSGSDNAEKIWNFLTRTAGFTKEGAAGLMGNLYAESALEPTNLQNSYERSLGMSDASYTSKVDDGSYNNFVNDSAGYGLAQWTYYSRKQKLLDYVKSKGASIGDLGTQLEFLVQELQSSYPSVYNTLKTASSLSQASNAVLLDFERPADQSSAVQAKRASYGETYYNQYAAGGSGSGKRKPLHRFLDLLSGGFGLAHFLRDKKRGGKGVTAGDAREAVVGWMLSLIGRNTYTMSSNRTRVMEGIDGHGYGDCSSTCWKIYEKACGIQIGTYTGDMYNTGRYIGSINTDPTTYPDESVMLPGDLVFFYSHEANPNDLVNSLGHVEMYIGNGCFGGHGGRGGGLGPFINNMKEYIDNRVASGYGTWACITRYITSDKIGSMTITPADPSKFKVANTFTDGKGFSANGANTSESVSGTAAGGNATTDSLSVTTTSQQTTANMLDKVSGFLSEVAARGMTGLFTGEFDSDYSSYWNGTSSTTTTGTSTTTSSGSSTGSDYPKYTDLTPEHKQVLANVITGETGGDSVLAARQEASQMANLNEVTYGRQANDAGIWSTLNSGWYARTSFNRTGTDIAKQAVEDVLVQGKRTLPRYVTEHDMFPLDAAISGQWNSGSGADVRAQYVRHQTQVVQNPSRFSGGGATYTFYDFFGENRDGDVAGYYPQHYEKYKNDTPWGGYGGRGKNKRGPATLSEQRAAEKAAREERIKRNEWRAKGITQGGNLVTPGTRATIAQIRRRKRGGYGTTPVSSSSVISSNVTSGTASYSNSSLLSILQRAEAAKGTGNESELFACMIEVLAIIADNTGVSANSLERANQLLATLQGTSGSSVIINKGSDVNTIPTTLQAATESKPSRNMQLAQRIAAGK